MKNVCKSAVITTDAGLHVLKLKFPWSLLNLEEIKVIRGRIWHKEKKFWTVPLTLSNCRTLFAARYTLSEEIIKWAKAANRLEKSKGLDLEIPELQGTLFPYQAEGVSFLERFNGRGLIADEMGLGKTVQALAWLQLHTEARPAVIVCPASLKLNWKKEAEKWMTTPDIIVLNGTKNVKLPKGGIIIVNYDVISHWLPVLGKCKPKAIVLDEVHKIKNSAAKRTKAVKALCQGIPHVIALSGTPIENRPVEIYNTINLIDPALFPSAWKFKQRYCDAKYNGFGWNFNGASNIPELHEILTKSVMIRRKKQDVLQDLPSKTYSFIPLEITNRREYQHAEDDFVEYVRKSVEINARKSVDEFAALNAEVPVSIDEKQLAFLMEERASKATPIAQIEALKQLAVRGKLDACIAWIEDFLESDEKLIVFAEHRFTIDTLMHHFGTNIAVKIDGGVSLKQRDLAVTAFQEDPNIRLFIGNRAAEVGLTLTAASNVAHIEYPWTPGALAQRTDRAHRIGQKFTVGVHYLLAVRTIEESIAEMLDSKQRVMNNVLDGKDSDSVNLLTSLINKYKK